MRRHGRYLVRVVVICAVLNSAGFLYSLLELAADKAPNALTGPTRSADLDFRV